jgi:hypothetical protein
MYSSIKQLTFYCDFNTKFDQIYRLRWRPAGQTLKNAVPDTATWEGTHIDLKNSAPNLEKANAHSL